MTLPDSPRCWWCPLLGPNITKDVGVVFPFESSKARGKPRRPRRAGGLGMSTEILQYVCIAACLVGSSMSLNRDGRRDGDTGLDLRGTYQAVGYCT